MRRVEGKAIKQTKRSAQDKREFVNARKLQQIIKKKEPIFLAIVRANSFAPKRRRGKDKAAMANVKVPASQGMTEKAKREFSKVVGPKKQFLTVEEREKEVI